MIKIVCTVLAIVVIAAAVFTVGFVGYETASYMVRQHFSFNEALNWAWDDYVNFIGLNKASADEPEYYEFVNKNIYVVACTSL